MSTQPDLIQTPENQPPPLVSARLRLARAYEDEHDAESYPGSRALADARAERVAAECEVARYEAAELARRQS